MSSAARKLPYRSCRGNETYKLRSNITKNSKSSSEHSFSDGRGDDERIQDNYTYIKVRYETADEVSVNKESCVGNIEVSCRQKDSSPSETCMCQYSSSYPGVPEETRGISAEFGRGISLISKLKNFFTWKSCQTNRASNCVRYDPSDQVRSNCRETYDGLQTLEFDKPDPNGGPDTMGDNFSDHTSDSNVGVGGSSAPPALLKDPRKNLSMKASCNSCMTEVPCGICDNENSETYTLQSYGKHTTMDMKPKYRYPSPSYQVPCGWGKNCTANAWTYPIESRVRINSRDSRWRRCDDRIQTFESPADRLVGLTLHCVILSLAVFAEKLTRWATKAVEFFFYLALHSAVYKGKVLPLREDTSEPVTKQQLREATMFDAAGLKIILLQYPPRRRPPALEFSCTSRLDSASLSPDYTAATTTTSTKKSTTSTTNHNISTSPTTSNNYIHHPSTPAPHKSVSLHSGSSQDLSHIFSVSSS